MVKATPVLTTQATPASIVLGGSVTDVATVAGGYNPTGSVGFALYGPGDDTCTGAPAFTSTVAQASGGATSAPFTPTATGTYRWVAQYSGDTNNVPVSGACGDPGETVTVLRIPTTLVVDPVVLNVRAGIRVSVGRVSARLTAGNPAVGLAGQTIVFRSRVTNAVICTAVTDATGRATCALSLAQTITSIVSLGVTGTYAGNASYLPSSSVAGLV